jgi:hypothetical protein
MRTSELRRNSFYPNDIRQFQPNTGYLRVKRNERRENSHERFQWFLFHAKYRRRSAIHDLNQLSVKRQSTGYFCFVIDDYDELA